MITLHYDNDLIGTIYTDKHLSVQEACDILGVNFFGDEEHGKPGLALDLFTIGDSESSLMDIGSVGGAQRPLH